MANTTCRRVAILGGNRIPFARSDGAYANASNQDMFTAALGGLIDRFNLERREAGRGDRRSGAQAQPRLQPDARMRPRQRAVVVHPRVRHPAGLRHGPAGDHRRRRRRRRRAVRRGRRRRGGHRLRCADRLRRRPAPRAARAAPVKSNVDRLKLVGKLPASLGVEIPVNSEPRTGLSMGEHQAITAKADGHQARRPGRAGRRQPPQHGRRLRPRLLRRPRHAVPRRCIATTTCGPIRRQRSWPRSSRCSG